MNLVFTLVFAAPIIFDIFTRKSYSESANSSANFVRDFVFFNGTHVFLTFVTLIALPEVRGLVRHSWRQNARWIYAGLALIAFLPLVKWISDQNLLEGWWIFALLLIPNILYFLHAVSQTCGLALLYNRRASDSLSEPEKTRLQKSEIHERRFYRVLIFLTVLTYLLHQMPTAIPPWILQVISYLSVLIALVFVIWGLTAYRGKIWRNKRLFMMRILIYPLLPFLGLGAVILGFWHGTEYFFMTTNMVHNSKKSRKRLLLLLLLPICLILIPPQIIYKQPELAQIFWGDWRSWPYYVRESIVLAAFSIDYLHYFLDGILFRFRQPHVRQYIGPLLRLSSPN